MDELPFTLDPLLPVNSKSVVFKNLKKKYNLVTEPNALNTRVCDQINILPQDLHKLKLETFSHSKVFAVLQFSAALYMMHYGN